MSDFVMQIGADLDLSKVQEQLDSIKKQKVTLDVEIKGNDDAHNLAKSIEKGLKSTKIDTSGLSKQLADAFNITDKSAIGKIKSQINSVMSELGKTWNGKEFNLQGGKGNAFVSGLSDLANSVAQNANIIQGKMGIYDQFYSYFKDKKIYVSDDLKKALSGDDYKELLNNNIGHIVRDASKGVSIDSIWGEMTSMFPEHFADNIVTQADQIKRAFEVLAQARQDMTQVISAENMTPEQAAGIKADAFDNVIAMSNQIRERLQQNIETASEGVKNTYDLDVDINTEKIVSDIRNAIQSVTGSEDAVQINVKINDEELLSQMRSAISQLATGDEPVQVDIQVNKQSLESDLEVALKDVELPIKFKIDAEQMATDIQAAVNQITDVEINLRVNTDSLRSSVEGAVNNGASTRTVDTSGMSEIQNILNNVNAAGMEGQSVFQSFGSTLRDAFSTFTAANLLTDAIYKVGDAARDAVSTVKSLDDATVALQLATGANYNTVHGMMNDYNALAKELGSLTTQVSEGADAWLRQGKSIDEVNNLVKSSMVLSKVGDMSSEDATKYLTASLNGYKLQADAAESVVSKISSVDLVSATDSSGLAEAMSRVAVTADQAGISMDRLLGYVATIGEVTQQSMSTVGTAMKSILTRMTNIKAGKLSLVDEDGTTEKLSDVETTLANVGINLRKTMTEYNSASDVLDALASKWDTMNQAQQNATSIAFGGQRMQNQFRILMQYYDRVQKYTDVAANSEGGGEQKFDLYLQGLESKTNSLKASLESLSSSLISRDLYAGFLDGSKAVVDFTEKTGLLKGALAGLGTAGATYALSQLVSMATSATKEFSNLSNALKMVKAAESAGTFDTSNMASLINLTKGLSESQTKLVLSSTALSDAQRVAVLMGQGMTEAQASAAVASMGLASAETTATGATVSLSSALSGLMSTLLANPLILIAAGVAAAVSAFSAYKRSIEEAVDKAQEAGSAWENNNTSLQDNIDKITELRTALDNGTLTEEEAYQAKSDLLEIQDSLTESYGNQAQGIDLVNGSLQTQISKLKELSTEESKRFLNENKKGVGERAGLNIEEFCKNAMDKGLMVLDEAGENYQVAGGKTMEDFAEGMNLSMPMVQAMFGEMQEFGANFDWSDEGIQTMGDIAVAATEASEALRSVAGNEDLKINLDVSDLKTTEEKCSALDDTISEMNSVKAKVGVDSSEVDQANTIIQYCVAQKQQLETPAVMNVDVSQVSGKIGEAVGLLQEFQAAQNTLQMQETLGMDTSEAQANVEAVADKIKGLDTNVKATLSIDDSSIDTIQESISSKLTNEVMVKAGIDDSAIIGFQETKHDAKGEVDWDNDTTKVDAYAAAQKKSDGTVLWSNDISQVKTQFQAVGHINWGNTSAPTNGANSVNGTAHASGTAKANGDWGNKRPGTTLVGELGREMCVNPHTGKWYTVGDNGAEFVNIPQGAIVFNHVQTEELLSNGFTASRAVALASGTSPDISGKAFVSGNAMVTGGISVKQAQKSVVSGGNTAKATNATNADTKATQSHTKATEESTETVKKSMKTFDWVATKLETWEKKVKKISDQITDYITSALKTSLLKKQMKTMSKEISSNTKGELAYMKKANSVAEKYTYYNSDGGEINVSIPKKYQKLVQSGAYRIEDMDTSTDEGKALAEAISEYQNWYEKAEDCKQAVIDLRNEQQKLFEQWANMPTEKAEKKIDRLTTGYNGINAVSSRLTAATKGGSTQAVLAQTMKEDLTEAKEQKKSDNKALKSAKTANKKASSAKKKADNKVKSTAKSLLKTNLTDEQKKQVQAGKKIDSTGMSGSQKKKADAYNKAVTNKTKANKKITSAKSKLSTAKSNYNSSNSTYNSMKSNVNEALNAYDSGDSLSYMNSLVDQQVSGKKLEQDARKTAVEQANTNLTTTKKQKTTSDKKLAKLQKKYKNNKNLTAAQKKKIAAGKEIDTTGITDAKQLKILTAYNNALADSKKKKENVTIATDALAEANENLMTAEVESAQATVEAVSTKFDNAKTYYEALLSYQEQLSKYQEKNIDLAKAHGDYEKSSDYDVKISNTQAERAIKQNELDELTKQLDDGVEAGTIVENSQEWLDMQTKIKEAQNAVSDYDTQIEELKQSQIGVYYEEQFDRAAEKVDRFRDKLDGLKSLISDDMKIDKNTGLLTESGALSITLDVDDINASTENLKTYIKERQQIINDYNAGKFGEDEYNQKLKDVDANIKSTTANIYSSRNSILELVKSQSQAELDVLNKVIDKRKEALSAKKNYYDYDKTLKNKTKDIEVLERQIAALEGSTSAEDKARKAKLQEQLQSAKDDLNDTIVDHAYSMQTDSLDKLSTDLSEDLDTWINKISSNMEEMTNAINCAISGAGLSTASTINAISSILRHYGLSDSEISQSGLTNITGYASGTDYVPKSGIYRVNEKGIESVFSKQYGTLTFLNQGDKVFDANFTKSLLDNATIATQKNMPDYAGMAKAIEKNIQNIQNLSGNTYVNNFYIDGAQDTDSILREIDKHLDKKIQAHDKKQVRDFRSLR